MLPNLAVAAVWAVGCDGELSTLQMVAVVLSSLRAGWRGRGTVKRVRTGHAQAADCQY